MEINDYLRNKETPHLSKTYQNLLMRVFDITDNQVSEEEIAKRYKESPSKDITILCAYTTRLEGFLDILLSKKIISSIEAKNLLGEVNTHRGDSMGWTFGSENNNISLSTGFVSFSYSDKEIESYEEFIGGLGILLPLDMILEEEELKFSHCSSKGGIKNYDLNRENIVNAVHQTRKEGGLFDDGYGNVFEILLESISKDGNKSMYSNVLKFPEIPVSNSIIAIPIEMKEKIKNLLIERQKYLQNLVELLEKEILSEETNFISIDNKDFLFPEDSIVFIKRMLEPIDLEKLPIYWYSHRNLNVALQYLSIKENT